MYKKYLETNRANYPLISLFVYLLIHLFVRIFFSQTLQVDDAEQIDHAQQLLLGYPIPQPPLYSWMSWIIFKLLGSTLLALTLLKYALITLTFWFTWLVSAQLFQHLQTRYIATFAYLLMPSFAWHMHQGFTHTILLGFGIIFSLHALLSLKNSPETKNYLYLGLAFGVGLMGKYSFVLFMLPIVISALTITQYRSILLNPKILLSLAIFLLVIGPHFYWLVQNYQDVFSSIDQKLQVSSANIISDRFTSVMKFFGSAIAFVLPFALVFLIGCWRELLGRNRETLPSDNQLLLKRFYQIIIVSTLTLALFFSMPHFKLRWFHPLMMLFPLWMLITIERNQKISAPVMRWFYGLVVLFTVLILLVRVFQVTIAPKFDKYGRLNRPIVETLIKLPKHLTSNSTLVSDDGFIGSHLLSQYPNNHVVIEHRHFRKEHSHKQCLWFWDDDDASLAPSPASQPKLNAITTNVYEYTYTLYYKIIPDCSNLLSNSH